LVRLAVKLLVVVLGAGFVLALGAGVSQASVTHGRWQGSRDGYTATFVVSEVGGTTVLSDLTVSCPGGVFGAGDDEDGVRHEAAIDSSGTIRYRAKPLSRIWPDGSTGPLGDFDGGDIKGRLDGRHGVVSVNPYAADGPDGGRTENTQCPSAKPLRQLSVTPVGGRSLQDGSYKVVGTQEDVTFDVYGEGSLIEWQGGFRTPVGGDPEEPELNCADLPISADILAWRGIFPSSSGTFTTAANGALAGAVTFGGHFVGDHAAAALWSAASVYPLVCAGSGGMVMTLSHPAQPLVPMTPVGTAPPPHRPPHRHHRRLRYVALGDSYSSGEGVAPYLPGTDTTADRCHRSTRAYSQLLRVPGERLVRSFYACSGATTANVLTASRYGEPAQITRPKLHGARLVTITIGGNDAAFSHVIKLCSRAVPIPCYKGAAAKRITGAIAALRGKLEQTYRSIRRAAGPGARIVALDYPNLFPAAGRSCRKLGAVYSAPARAFIRRAGGELDDEIEAAARAVHVRFVDVRPAFADHEICSAHEWVDYFVRHGVVGSFHPNAAGQAAYARVLARSLR
jgi:lysophospholipase L1-like esterase